MRTGMPAGHHRPHGSAMRLNRSELTASPPRVAGTALPATRPPRTVTSAEEGATGGNPGSPGYIRPQNLAVLGQGQKPRVRAARTAVQICSSGVQWSAVPLWRKSHAP